MEQFELKAEKRTIIGKKVKGLRREGLIPAVLYGPKTEPIPIQCYERELQHVLARAGGTNMISVRIGKAHKPKMALARGVQRDVITGELCHVDFYQVVMTETVKTEVNIILSGEPPAVQQKEFMLLQGTDSVEVECLPGDLIHSIEVDLSTLLEIDDAIYVKDLQVPDNVTILTDGDELVAKIQRLRLAEEEEEVEEEMVEMAPEEVEVIAKGKEEVGEKVEPEG
ncbi:MAG: 50S ribosomal protein L25 [Anaerolineae bacterium]|nr:50S ribosomal protein L25 [Anaerolineae bacterium]